MKQRDTELQSDAQRSQKRHPPSPSLSGPEEATGQKGGGGEGGRGGGGVGTQTVG